MYSSLLKEKGLHNFIAGSEYNFRYQNAGKEIVKDVERALEKMGIQPREIYSGQQVHGNNVQYVDGTNGERFIYGKTFKETDGLITDQPGVALLIKYADCTPVVLYDPVKQVQASVHSGWRGTVQRISIQAINKMVNEFGCDRNNILAFLGPSIDQDNYEVGSEVYEAFHEFENRDDFFEPKGDKYHMSMLDANLDILVEAGIKAENIEIERTSTYTSPHLHSSRQEGKDYQLNAIITMLE